MRQKKRSILLFISIFVLLFGLLLFGRIDVRQADAATDYQELQLFTDVLTIVKRSYVEEVTMISWLSLKMTRLLFPITF